MRKSASHSETTHIRVLSETKKKLEELFPGLHQWQQVEALIDAWEKQGASTERQIKPAA